MQQSRWRPREAQSNGRTPNLVEQAWIGSDQQALPASSASTLQRNQLSDPAPLLATARPDEGATSTGSRHRGSRHGRRRNTDRNRGNQPVAPSGVSEQQPQQLYEELRHEAQATMAQTASADAHTARMRERRKPTKSNIPGLVQQLMDRMASDQTECMICMERVRRAAAVWSCGMCYSMFHLPCVRKWARASINNQGHAEQASWRCPGCQSVCDAQPHQLRYTCFCGRLVDPPMDPYLTPHSCGDACSRHRANNCPHPCTLMCHPGPCPPCSAMSAPKTCFCGQTTYQLRCSEPDEGRSCGAVCNKMLACGRHLCQRTCHEGDCGSCQQVLVAQCHCGRVDQDMGCDSLELAGPYRPEEGAFSCGEVCGSPLHCGNHKCCKTCHRGPCGECQLLPSNLQTCPCGKVSMQSLTLKPRRSCLDPVPTCGSVCDKLLSCGLHHCPVPCHTGECPPCTAQVKEFCRCNSMARNVPCSAKQSRKLSAAAFTCNKKCGLKKSCGRHRCTETCCPAHADSTDPSGIHVCQLSCGKMLRCGIHKCEQLCHSGYCPPCLQASMEELSCACGRTVLQPPVPCGTALPPCPYPCIIPQPCGHRPKHTCHEGDCPPCNELISRRCLGDHVTLTSVPCGSQYRATCSQPCGRVRRCGQHTCLRPCHLPPCDDPELPGLSCGQQCDAQRRTCSHACKATCHAGQPCPETACSAPVTITCACSRVTAEVPCGSGAGSMSSAEVDQLTRTIAALPLPLSSQLGALSMPAACAEAVALHKVPPLGQQSLACDEECARRERQRQLADAFDATLPVDGNPGKTELLEAVRRNPEWVGALEHRFTALLAMPSATMRVHILQTMTTEQRAAVHELASMWRLVTSSHGVEPHRYVVVSATRKSRPPTPKYLVHWPSDIKRPPYNHEIDRDPASILAFNDIPRDADVASSLVRFGGECELVWVDDRNALAIFDNRARALAAMRLLSHSRPYSGVVAAVPAPSPSAPSVTPRAPAASWIAAAGSGKGRRMKSTTESWQGDAWGSKEETFKVVPGAVPRPEPAIVPQGTMWDALADSTPTSTSKGKAGAAARKQATSSKTTDARADAKSSQGTAAARTAASSKAINLPVNSNDDDWEHLLD